MSNTNKLLVGLAFALLLSLVGFGAAAVHAASVAPPAVSSPSAQANNLAEAPIAQAPLVDGLRGGAVAALGPVSVCVLDTGVRASHEDLAPYVAESRDFLNDSAPIDENGHGTEVASLVVAAFRHALPDAPASDLRLLVGRVADADGKFLWSDLLQGLAWCQEQGGDVINLSLGDAVADAQTAAALAAASDAGILLVAAAGNSGPCHDCVEFPARDSHVIAVGCVDASGAACSFSAQGPEIDVVAPGLKVLSASFRSDAAHVLASGTSMSAPAVSGALAALESLHPDLDAAQLRAQLESQAQDQGPQGRDAVFGFGLLAGIGA